ncbi:uncharacterized protein LOC101737726 [Bombyx mori]|uniref:Hexosyltransferase n=2 Tax=Bombyx TaxID=7090 RepID=A0A8R2C661_BOMMO|nr:uncharacterized protein LOC101737726 isoform X2 [Bombyx mori]
MEYSPSHKNWHDEERYHVHSDESPVLSYRHEKYKNYTQYSNVKSVKEEVKKRSTFSILAKFFLFSSAVILFCVLMYIPVYNKANNQISKAIVSGWSVHSNRDTKLYVRPQNVTVVHEPTALCTGAGLFLLIVVCSATGNFEQRQAIRDTWGSQARYTEIRKVSVKIREKYKNYNYSYDLIGKSKRMKREIADLSNLLPHLAAALRDNVDNLESEAPEKRFDDEMLPEFDMNREIGEQTENYDYNFESNVMRIPPRGFEDNPDLDKVLSILKLDKRFLKVEEKLRNTKVEPDFKLAFILGLPVNDSNSAVQRKIDEEIDKYGDIIQEDFIDSYNNLTLKSIMMLKWINNKCKDKVRYILKTDDDMYINVVNLVNNLRNKSKEFDERPSKGPGEREYLLLGDLICGARPVQDANNKWYSPRYMYNARVYPKYLSGTGYVMSVDAAAALYRAALNTNYFHLEDIYITGMCAMGARPLLVARDDPLFSYSRLRGGAACSAHARVTAHRVGPPHMRSLDRMLTDQRTVDKCERVRLTEVKPQNRSMYVAYRYTKLHRLYNCD